MSGVEKKLVSRNVAIVLGIICVVALTGLVGVYINYTSIINSKDTIISGLNTQVSSLQSQLVLVRSLPAMNLTLIGASGQQKVLNSSSIAALTAYAAKGGTRSNSGSLANYGNYTGIPILALLNLVGGITSSNTVKVTASDSFISTLTYAQVNGQGITAYSTNGNQATPAQALTMIVAYYCNGTSLVSGLGPLRVAIVGNEGIYTTGSLWAKMVVKIQIIA